MAQFSESISTLSIPALISRVRRNHGLEHATLHVLAARYPHRSFAGHSDFRGFWIVGEIDTQDLADAVEEALRRLNGGEHHLAVHPNCGTNFVTSGTLAAGGALLGMLGVGRSKTDKLERLPVAITLATLALIAAQPLGLQLQAGFTTDGHPNGLRVVEVMQHIRGGVTTHRVGTSG
jgi:hypothetical protein